MKVLVVDPAPDSRDALRQAISGAGAQFRGLASLAEARRHLAGYQPDVVVAALDLPDGDASLFLAEVARGSPRRAAWAIAPAGDLEDAVAAMSRGADDFLWRPVSAERVSFLLEKLRARREGEARAEETRLSLARVDAAAALPGRSARWAEAMSAIERLAPERAVLVTGEEGTEKEAAALFLHRLSPRGAEPFVRAAGADLRDALARAGRGTVFLSGIDAAPAAVQELALATLDRVDRGGLILASDHDPADSVRRGELLAAIPARLESSVVHLPPLRERGEDVGRLARHFLEETGTLAFDAEAMEALAAHDWPGNVQELREAVRRAAELAEGPTIGPIVVRSVLSRPLNAPGSRRRRAPVVRIAVGDSLAEVERRLIQKTLEFAKGNKKKTAELLKLSLKTIYNKIKEYGLEH
ncbi:MAG TPA: helix-turn-helix domain-containing protein [Thermoanaerobaculia bacterium]|nr:helix-turn-helix domain-containing protein [Thermoanaerobaculia bacterium]